MSKIFVFNIQRGFLCGNVTAEHQLLPVTVQQLTSFTPRHSVLF